MLILLFCLCCFFFIWCDYPRSLHSFPTRRSSDLAADQRLTRPADRPAWARQPRRPGPGGRTEEHTSELQSRGHLECRVLVEKKNKEKSTHAEVSELVDYETHSDHIAGQRLCQVQL